MKESDSLLVFMLGDQRYALLLHAVDRVVRMVSVTPLPEAPDIVLGVVNIQGRVVPVINMRRRFHVPERKVALTDRLVIARTARRPVALVADAVLDIIAWTAPVAAEDVVPGAKYVEGVVKLEDGLIFIHDLDKFLSLEEEKSLGYALETS